MKVELYHIVMVMFAITSAIDEVQNTMQTYQLTWSASIRIFKAFAAFVGLVGMSRFAPFKTTLSAFEYRYAARAWMHDDELATQFTWHLVSVRDFIRSSYASKSRKYWTSSSRLRRAISSGEA